MFSKKLLIILTLLSPTLVSCVADSNADSPTPEISFGVIVSGDNTMNGLQENRKIEVFADQVSLNASLALYERFITEHTVDFRSKRAVLLSMGGRSTGGYSIKVDAVEDYDDYIKLKVLLTKPGNNCITTQALTSPYQFIEIESDKELVIEEKVMVVNCNQ